MNPLYKIYQEKSKERKSNTHKQDIDLGDIMYYNNIIIRIMRRIKYFCITIVKEVGFMDYLERIERWNSLVRRISTIEKLLATKTQRLANIRQKCPHEVVVCIEKRQSIESVSNNIHMKCIFCGKETIEESVFKNAEIIDVSKFKERNRYNAKAKFKLANAMFLRMAERKPELSAREVAKLTNLQLQAENEKFKKVNEEK